MSNNSVSSEPIGLRLMGLSYLGKSLARLPWQWLILRRAVEALSRVRVRLIPNLELLLKFLIMQLCPVLMMSLSRLRHVFPA